MKLDTGRNAAERKIGRRQTIDREKTDGTTDQKAEAYVAGNKHKSQYMNCLVIVAKMRR